MLLRKKPHDDVADTPVQSRVAWRKIDKVSVELRPVDAAIGLNHASSCPLTSSTLQCTKPSRRPSPTNIPLSPFPASRQLSNELQQPDSRAATWLCVEFAQYRRHVRAAATNHPDGCKRQLYEQGLMWESTSCAAVVASKWTVS